MKKKSVKKEFIILAVVIVALSLYLMLQDPDKMQYDLPRLDAISVETLTSIEIQKPGETIRLVKGEGKWSLDPQGFPADEKAVKDITNAVKDFELVALVSQAKNYVPYGLDAENRIVARAFQGEEVVREFEVGNVASTYRHTFVKLPEDDRIYHSSKAFRNYFNKKIEDLRDKSVLKFDQSEISQVQIDWKNRNLTFAKKVTPVEAKADENEEAAKEGAPAGPTEMISWITPAGIEGNRDILDNLIRDLADLSCQKYENKKGRQEYKDPIYTVTLKGAEDYSLSIYAKVEADGGSYPALSTGNAYPFHLATYKAEGLMKKVEEFFPKEKDK
jgi:hypothetical protein